MNIYSLVAVFILALVVYGGFFFTKKEGFGPFNTGVTLAVSCLFLGAIFFISGKIEKNEMLNILFTVLGYSGGLLTNRINKKVRKRSK